MVGWRALNQPRKYWKIRGSLEDDPQSLGTLILKLFTVISLSTGIAAPGDTILWAIASNNANELSLLQQLYVSLSGSQEHLCPLAPHPPAELLYPRLMHVRPNRRLPDLPTLALLDKSWYTRFGSRACWAPWPAKSCPMGTTIYSTCPTSWGCECLLWVRLLERKHRRYMIYRLYAIIYNIIYIPAKEYVYILHAIRLY
jgi:hypothetical protein